MSDLMSNPLSMVFSALVIILLCWTVFQQISLSKIKKRQGQLFAGSEGKDLESIIINTKNKIRSIDGDIKDLYEITGKIHQISHSGLHKMGIVRFNPFRDIGGDQSFSVALLDGNNNGVVISSLYSRDGVRVYAKQLKDGTCEHYQLTEEEKHAIKISSAKKDGTKNKKKV